MKYMRMPYKTTTQHTHATSFFVIPPTNVVESHSII